MVTIASVSFPCLRYSNPPSQPAPPNMQKCRNLVTISDVVKCKTLNKRFRFIFRHLSTSLGTFFHRLNIIQNYTRIPMYRRVPENMPPHESRRTELNLSGTSFIIRFLFFPFWGRLAGADIFGWVLGDWEEDRERDWERDRR